MIVRGLLLPVRLLTVGRLLPVGGRSAGRGLLPVLRLLTAVRRLRGLA